MKINATILTLLLFVLVFLAPTPAGAELRLAVLKVKGMVCDS